MGLRVGRRQELPRPPVEIADAVEMYARESGRHATLHFVPLAGWMARFTLRSDDKRMTLYQENRVGDPPTEDVWFHKPNPRSKERGQPAYIQYSLDELGVSGVRQFLERGNTWSGRGEFYSIEEQAAKAMKANAAMKEGFRAEQKELNRYEQREKRRSRFRIPILPVGVELGGDTAAGD